jgi:hypothetical protein
MLWLVIIYAKDLIQDLRLVKHRMTVVRNIAEDVKFIIATMVCSVLIAEWHYGCHQLIKVAAAALLHRVHPTHREGASLNSPGASFSASLGGSIKLRRLLSES